MTEPEVKIMKLSSGEEIICCLVADEHPRTFNVRYPMKVMTVPRVTDGDIEESLSLVRWIHFAEDMVADIPKGQVLAVVNASIGMKRFYEYCINKLNAEGDLGEPSEEDLMDEEEEYYDEELDEWQPISKTYH